MRLIDVLVRQCNGEIRKGTKLIVDFSYEQNDPETYTYNGARFVNGGEYDYDCIENYGARTEILNAEVKLIEPQLYYLKMPNSHEVLGINGNFVFFELLRNVNFPYDNEFLFAKDEIDSMDTLAPYRNFEWSEYRDEAD